MAENVYEIGTHDPSQTACASGVEPSAPTTPKRVDTTPVYAYEQAQPPLQNGRQGSLDGLLRTPERHNSYVISNTFRSAPRTHLGVA
jgi:hypothetical protein